MLKSMTGFGRGVHYGKWKKVSVEIRAVNSRYGEVKVRVAQQFVFLEEKIRHFSLSQFSRGYVEIFLKLENTEKRQTRLQVNESLALAYYEALQKLATSLGLPLEIKLGQIAEIPEIFVAQEIIEIEELWLDVQPALQEAWTALLQMRQKEGEKLKKDLLQRVAKLDEIRAEILARSPQVVDQYREKLALRLTEVLEEIPVDEARLMMELAIFAERSNLTEELVRLASHFKQLADGLEAQEPIGRELDFLLQEINREINTIGSKAHDLSITQAVVALKSELEKIREQVQNIE